LRIPIQDLELLPLLLVVGHHFGELVELLLEVEVHQLEESVPGDPRAHHIHRLILLPTETGPLKLLVGVLRGRRVVVPCQRIQGTSQGRTGSWQQDLVRWCL
jgi:hypothetical protein